MAELLSGKETAEAMLGTLEERVKVLRSKNVIPKLAIVRCGAKPADLAYEKGISARAQFTGVEVDKFVLPENADSEMVKEVLTRINFDENIHGCIMFRPLPEHLAAESDGICNTLIPQKDVDCMTDLSNAGVFTGKNLGFAPCTAEACMKILEHYKIECRKKRAVVIGRSLVVGKPAAMMLLKKDATVTICHTKTEKLSEITRQADIIITAAGALKSLTAEHVRPGQTIIDVSMNWDENKLNSKGEKGAMSGDSDFENIEPIVKAITPVPGGVGAVTNTVLTEHVICAAENSLNRHM